MSGALTVVPLPGIPEVERHHDLGVLLRRALEEAGQGLAQGDVLVVVQQARVQGLGAAHGCA